MISNVHRIKTLTAVLGMVFLLVIALACGIGADGVPAPVKDYPSLLNSLTALGANVGFRGFAAEGFFTETQARLLKVNNEDVLVFQFRGEQEADSASKTVSANGNSVGASTMSGAGPPHFYKAGTLIVLYFGSNSSVINVLQESMGSQFAGQ